MVNGVILAGGAGTRLWPMSSSEKPKQFLKLLSDKSMLRETSDRILPVIPRERQWVLTGEIYKETVREELGGDIRMFCEPMAKSTAPCILWAAKLISGEQGEDAVLAVMPSDHLVKKRDNLIKALERAAAEAQKGYIVTFGIVPTRVETGYGYIELPSRHYSVNEDICPIVCFKEKPDKATAQEYLSSGRYVWNSGMFVFRADTMIEEFKRYAPDVYECFDGIDVYDEAQVKGAFEKVRSISIDYAVMEHTQKGRCLPSEFGWDDVGGYNSLFDECEKDEANNVLIGEAYTCKSSGCYINAKSRVVAVGLEDIVIVENNGVILVAKKDMNADIGSMAKMITKRDGK